MPYGGKGVEFVRGNAPTVV